MEEFGSSPLPLAWRSTTDDDDDPATLELTGELDRLTAPTLAQHLDDLLTAGRNPIVLDVSEVRFMDLGGYQLFVDVGAACAGHGRWLVLRRPGPAVRRLVDLIGVPDGVLVST